MTSIAKFRPHKSHDCPDWWKYPPHRSDVWEASRADYITGWLSVCAQIPEAHVLLKCSWAPQTVFLCGVWSTNQPARSFLLLHRPRLLIPAAQEMKQRARPACSGPVHDYLSQIIGTSSFIWASLWEKVHVFDILAKERTYWEQNQCFDGTFLETRHERDLIIKEALCMSTHGRQIYAQELLTWKRAFSFLSSVCFLSTRTSVLSFMIFLSASRLRNVICYHYLKDTTKDFE